MSAAVSAAALPLLLPLLAADARLRAAGVCRAWREALRDPALWHALRLAPGGACDALLAAAAARARGGLRTLDVTGCAGVSLAAITEVIRDNPGLTHALCTCGASGRVWPAPLLRAVLAAAPALRELRADVSVTCLADAAPLLARAPPFAPLRCRCLRVDAPPEDGDAPEWSHADLLALAELVATGEGAAELTALNVTSVQLGVLALEALMRAAVARRLRQVHLAGCGLGLRATPALTALLRGNAVEDLLLCGLDGSDVHEPEEYMLMCTLRLALVLCTSVHTLHLAHVELLSETGVRKLLQGVREMASLTSLTIFKWRARNLELLDALGTAAADVVGPGTPPSRAGHVLRTLRVVYDTEVVEQAVQRLGLSHIARALHPAATLRVLQLSPAPTCRAVAEQLLEGVRRASALRELQLGTGEPGDPPPHPLALQAVALVAARRD